MRRALLQLDRGYPGLDEALEKDFRVIRPRGNDPEGMIREYQNDIQAIVTNLTPVSHNLIEALPNLEIIALGAVGYDHVDLVATKARGIAVTNTPDVLTNDTADTAIFLMLSILRRGVEGDAFVRAGMWKNGPLPMGHSVSGKKVGIVGLGRIGQAIAKRCAAFGVEISYFGPNKKSHLDYTYFDTPQALATHVDILILACPGGEATRHMVDHSILKALGEKGYLVNIARGSVIDESDLLVALSNKTIAGAALDVFQNEPHVPESFFSMDNVVLTPHIGSATYETRRKMGEIVIENLRAYYNGEKLLTPVL
jgi:hydroxypyruvate reductase